MELACGLNRFVIHTSVHQPVDDKIPGLGLGPFGQWFTRHETWAEQAVAWTTYLARSSYMLQQGQFIADVAYLYGEGNNITALFGQKLPEIPAGYEFDFINADALINVLEISKNGFLSAQSGVNYRLLVLDRSTRQMTAPVLKKISDLVKGGAVVVGSKPESTPSLADDAAEFELIASELWPSEKSATVVGKGMVYSGYSLKEVIEELGITPDFIYTKPQQNTEMLYVHHRIGNTDFYWINNRNNRIENVDATFRVTGKKAEIWHPETGIILPSSFRIDGNVTHVPLHLEPNDAVFVVFREKSKDKEVSIPSKQEEVLMTVEGPWDVSFQKERGNSGACAF